MTGHLAETVAMLIERGVVPLAYGVQDGDKSLG